jgi:aquaporin NIP
MSNRLDQANVRHPIDRSFLVKKVCAEMIGTFALVFGGCGAIVVNEISKGQIGHLGISTTFGLIIMVMIYATGHISGAHFNPAVTIAFASVGRFEWREVPAYVIGQLVAAVAAAFVLKFLFGDIAHLGTTGISIGIGQAFVLEILITFMLMFVITSVATDSRAVGQQAGWAIGGTVLLAAIFAGPMSGASMNPARSLGPALASGTFDVLWLYMIAPIIGAVLGAHCYRLIRCGGDETDAAGCC